MKLPFLAAMVLVSLVTIGWGEETELLELREVVTEATAGALKATHEYRTADGDAHQEDLWLAANPIVTTKEIADVFLSPSQADALAVQLTPEGGMKLGEATKDGAGKMRIAVVIKGKVMSAPVVMAKLGKRFVITGFDDAEELHIVMWQLQGKSSKEIAKLLRRNVMQKLVIEYHTDEEYAELKRSREKMGLHYVDRIPSEEELAERLKQGMTPEEVTAEFGKASRIERLNNGENHHFDLAPEKLAISDDSKASGFMVRYRGGRVVVWLVSRWTTESRAPKPLDPPESFMQPQLPEDLVEDLEFASIEWMNQIQMVLQDGHDKPHANDYMTLVNFIHNSAVAEEGGELDADCSIVKTLALGFPEVQKLRGQAKEEKVSLADLSKLLSPYRFGEKPLPKAIAGE